MKISQLDVRCDRSQEPRTTDLKGEMMTTFDEDESYELFLILDTLARIRKGEDRTVNYFRERLLPTYRDWHEANPFMAHPAFPIDAVLLASPTQTATSPHSI